MWIFTKNPSYKGRDISAFTHCSSSKLPHMNFQENLCNGSRDKAKNVHCSLSTVIVTITACRECMCRVPDVNLQESRSNRIQDTNVDFKIF